MMPLLWLHPTLIFSSYSSLNLPLLTSHLWIKVLICICFRFRVKMLSIFFLFLAERCNNGGGFRPVVYWFILFHSEVRGLRAGLRVPILFLVGRSQIRSPKGQSDQIDGVRPGKLLIDLLFRNEKCKHTPPRTHKERNMLSAFYVVKSWDFLRDVLIRVRCHEGTWSG